MDWHPSLKKDHAGGTNDIADFINREVVEVQRVTLLRREFSISHACELVLLRQIHMLASF